MCTYTPYTLDKWAGCRGNKCKGGICLLFRGNLAFIINAFLSPSIYVYCIYSTGKPYSVIGCLGPPF